MEHYNRFHLTSKTHAMISKLDELYRIIDSPHFEYLSPERRNTLLKGVIELLTLDASEMREMIYSMEMDRGFSDQLVQPSVF